MRHYNSANTLVRSDYIDQGGPDTISTTWQQKGGRFTTPSNGAKVSIQLWIQLGSGWVTYDDVSLRPVVTYNLSYDAENRLSGVSGAATATFVYDGDGKRVKATAGGVTTAYVGNYFEWTGSTSTMVKYYYAGTTRIAMRVGSNNPKWLLSDHLGSQSIVASYDGLTEEGELRYKAWGETRYTSGTTPTKRQYSGQLSEMTTIGLYFYGAKFYDPALSRFTSADSIIPGAGDVQAWDRYAAMLNNPLKYVDPTGHRSDAVMHDSDGDAACNDFEHCMKVTEPQLALAKDQEKILSDIEKNYKEDRAFLWGANFSGSGVPNYSTGGVEELFLLKDRTRATYKYAGQGSAVGEGASATVYGGIVINLEKPEDYRENSAAVGITLSVLEKGVTISYFWNTNNPPLTPGNVQGFTIGYSPGAQASIWSAVTYYELWELIR